MSGRDCERVDKEWLGRCSNQKCVARYVQNVVLLGTSCLARFFQRKLNGLLLRVQAYLVALKEWSERQDQVLGRFHPGMESHKEHAP